MSFSTFILLTPVISIVVYLIWKKLFPDEDFFFGLIFSVALTYLLFGPSNNIHYTGNGYVDFNIRIFPILKIASAIIVIITVLAIYSVKKKEKKEELDEKEEQIRKGEKRKRDEEEANRIKDERAAEKKRNEMVAERKRIEEEAEIERDRPFRKIRKQKAIEIFSELQALSRNPLYGEGISYKIKLIMHRLSYFATDHINLTDAELEHAKRLIEEIKTNWKEVEVKGFAEKRRDEEQRPST